MKIQRFPFLYIYKHKSDNEIYFAIDRLVQGKCTGGIRVREGIEPKELLDNALLMSKKMAVANLPCGGAKLGLNLKNPKEKRSVLTDFGNRISSLLSKNIFIPGMDMQSNIEDVKTLLGSYAGSFYRLDNNIDSSFYTAFGVYTYLKIFKRKFFSYVDTLSCGMEGCGKVGTSLLKILRRDNRFKVSFISDETGTYSISGKDTIERILNEKENDVWKKLSEILPEPLGLSSEVKYSDVDILIPGATQNFIMPEDVGKLKIKAIIPNSNLPYHPDSISLLKERHIKFIPEYFPNTGGVFGSMLGNIGFDPFYTSYIINKHFNLIFDYVLKEAGRPENFYETGERLINEKLNTPFWKGGMEEKFITQYVSKLSNYFNYFPKNIRRRFVTTWYLPYSAMWSWNKKDINQFKL